VDITSKLIFEAYSRRSVSKSELIKVELIEFRRDISNHFINDFFRFEDVATKERFNVFQIFDKLKDDKPGTMHSTAVFHTRYPSEEGMIFHSIDRNLMKELPMNLVAAHAIHKHPYFKDKRGFRVLEDILDQVNDFDMKKRSIEAMGMKLKTKEHFGDILGSLSESKKNNESEIVDFNRIYSKNSGERYNKMIDEITVRYNTINGVKYYEILQYFSYSVDEKTPMFLGLELKKKVLDKKTKRWETNLIPLRKHNQGGKPLTYIGGYELYDGLTNNTLDVDKDTFEVLKIALMSQKERLKILSTKNMKPKTKEHFGDIIGSL